MIAQKNLTSIELVLNQLKSLFRGLILSQQAKLTNSVDHIKLASELLFTLSNLIKPRSPHRVFKSPVC